uniref:Uncharacterized protein n=1 Tax=Brassica oleracea var. oleracea TaxID=109376 RepID=A0A0D3DBY1_BRAOL
MNIYGGLVVAVVITNQTFQKKHKEGIELSIGRAGRWVSPVQAYMGCPWSGPNSTCDDDGEATTGEATTGSSRVKRRRVHRGFIDDGFIEGEATTGSSRVKRRRVHRGTMDFDTPNLIDEEDGCYLANEAHEDDPVPQESGSSERGISSSSSSRRRAKCWNNFTPGEKHSDGKTDVTCKAFMLTSLKRPPVVVGNHH